VPKLDEDSAEAADPAYFYLDEKIHRSKNRLMPASPNIIAEHLFVVLHKASKAVSLFDQRSIKELGFANHSDFAVLEYLKTKGPQPVNTIGRSIMLTSGSITTAVDRIEIRGLVKRLPCPEDRRVTRVELTPKGHQLIDAAFESHAANLERLFNVLNRNERLEFLRLVKKVGKAAEALNL
jgi:MarR family 2-MHQ and catechol resistance regulon transcriptional repressor